MSSFEANSTSERSASLDRSVSPKDLESASAERRSSERAGSARDRRIQACAAAAGFGRCVKLLPQSTAVFNPVPRRRRTAAAMFAPLELLGQTQKLEVIVARH